MINRGLFESGHADVVMAYPTSELSIRQAVRLDFRWVVQLQYTSFWAAEPAADTDLSTADRLFALNVLDNSPLVRRFAAGYADSEGFIPLVGNRPAQEVLRHFHICFDDFGSYDVLAIDCIARSFTVSQVEPKPRDPDATPVQRAAEKAQKEAALLADAMSLPPPPPLLSYP